MADKRVLFGSGYEYDVSKTREENWEAMKDYYAEKGIKVGEMPEQNNEIDKMFEEMKPQFEKAYDEVVKKK